MKKLFFNLSIGVLTSLLLASCATIMTGTKTPIYVSSYPAGSTIKVDGVESGVTPSTVILKRKTFKKTKIEVSKTGYKTGQFPLERKFVWWTLLMPWGAIVDLFTGGMFNYSPKMNYVELAEKNGKTTPKYNAEDFCYIVTEKKDTIYCYPDINLGRNIKYTTLGGNKEKISAGEVMAIKGVEFSKGPFLILGVHVGKAECKEVIYERRQVSLKKNKTDKTELLQLVLRNGEYSLFSTTTANVNVSTYSSGPGGGAAGASYGGTGGGSSTYYYLYKGNSLIEDGFVRKKTFAKYKQHFTSKKGSMYPKNKKEYDKIFDKRFN